VITPFPLCHCSLISCKPFSPLSLLSLLYHLSHTLFPWPSFFLSPLVIFLHVPLIFPFCLFFLSLQPSLVFSLGQGFLSIPMSSIVPLYHRSLPFDIVPSSFFLSSWLLPSAITLCVPFCHCFLLFAIVLFPLLNLSSLYFGQHPWSKNHGARALLK